MANNTTKNVNKPTKSPLKKEDSLVTSNGNNPLDTFDFNDVAAQHEQASFNVAQYRPGDEHNPSKNPHKIPDRIYYIYSADSNTLIDQSGYAGKQELTGTLNFYDIVNNTTLTLTLHAVELSVFDPVYEGRYVDNIIGNNYLTPYGKWTYWVTTDDGMDMTITMNQTGISTYLAGIEYETDKSGKPVGQIPDFGSPWLVNPTVDDIEHLFEITWDETNFTDINGNTNNYLLYQRYGNNANSCTITKENALVFLGDDLGTAYGSPHDDTIYGEGGEDYVWGFDGNDTLVGGAGFDYFVGGDGDDVMLGGDGDDIIRVYTDTNSFYSTDYIAFAEGNDTVTGGSGSDVFFFGTIHDGGNYIAKLDAGVTTITDFTAGEDRLCFWELGGINNVVQGVNPIAQDYDDYLLYNTATQKLYIDADGSGDIHQAIHFATLVGFTGVLTDAELGYY